MVHDMNSHTVLDQRWLAPHGYIINLAEYLICVPVVIKKMTQGIVTRIFSDVSCMFSDFPHNTICKQKLIFSL